MRNFFLLFCIVFSFFISAESIWARSSNELPGYVNERSYPDSVQTEQKQESWWKRYFCRWFGSFESFGCQAVRTQHILSPDTLQADVSNEEGEAAKAVLNKTDQQPVVQGVSDYLSEVEKDIDNATTEEQILGISSVLSALYNRIVGGGEQGTGYSNMFSPDAEKICTNSDNPEDCTEKLAIALLPDSMQGKVTSERTGNQNTSAQNPDGIQPISDTNNPAVPEPPFDPSAGSIPSAEPTSKGTIYSENNYSMYYQIDPTISGRRLPAGCTYGFAACGPTTATNILLNLGYKVNPVDIINTYYSDAGCAGTGIEEGRVVIIKIAAGYSAKYIITGVRDDPWEAAPIIKGQTDLGRLVWLHGEFYSASAGKWFGHHLTAVKVVGNEIYVLDPYYGFNKPIPMSLLGYQMKVENAFVVYK